MGSVPLTLEGVPLKGEARSGIRHVLSDARGAVTFFKLTSVGCYEPGGQGGLRDGNWESKVV